MNVSKKALINEVQHVEHLLGRIKLSNAQQELIHNDAFALAKIMLHDKSSKIESFIQQYNISTQEGVSIMCLAEGLLRIPDKKTADDLIADKIKFKNWYKFIGQSDSFFVNSSTFGLVISNIILKASDIKLGIGKAIATLSEPVLRVMLKQAMKIISNQFIIGYNLEHASRNAAVKKKQGYTISYDILGESARNKEQANFYFNEYKKAILLIGANKNPDDNISIKLSALYPRFEYLKLEAIDKELIPKVTKLVMLCKKINISVSFDAEEATRLDAYLHVITKLIKNRELRQYNGIGVVIQAYQKRAIFAIEYLIQCAKKYKKRLPIRLVKGAYWDYEIKNAQQHGLNGYPVFTKKEYTDVSYIACTQIIFDNTKYLYPQFATHNARSVATIKAIAYNKDFEFQKLYGMGDSLYSQIVKDNYKCRVYAPVGEYKELLPYLMRRLLENGANTSFVNLIANKNIDIQEIIEDPIAKTRKSLRENIHINMPENIFSSGRKNSSGYDLGIAHTVMHFKKNLKKYYGVRYDISSIISNKSTNSDTKIANIYAPNDRSELVGSCQQSTTEMLKKALDLAHKTFPKWSRIDVHKRANIIDKTSDLLHKNRFELYAILMREAGKNIHDAIDEVREAIDFARYYAKQAVELMGAPKQMDSSTGEDDLLSYHSKGVFVCISPWNFPLAIFLGQIFAAIVTGNVVIAKPAETTPIIAHIAIKLLIKAGLPADVLQLVITSGKSLSENIISDNRICGVCFTGSTAVGQRINRTLAQRDTALATLIAETGGQNCMIVDSSALLEQATDDIIVSAFGSVGQRCSALRVLYIQQEIYNKLLQLIIGAMHEIKIGNTKDLSVDLGALISDVSKKDLESHIKTMKYKKHKIISNNEICQKNQGHYFAPSIVQINHIKEIEKENFGAILHVKPYKYEQLDDIIEEINSTGFGLTFGLHSRIEARINHITSHIKAGNIYINRTMIGAQVESQCFGGEGISGTGFKAGGPNYLRKFVTERLISNNTTAIGGDFQLLNQAIT